MKKTLESGGTCDELEEIEQSNGEITSETTAQKEPCPFGTIPLVLDKMSHEGNTPLVSMDCKISEIECNPHGISRVHEFMSSWIGDRSWMVPSMVQRWLFRYARTIPRPFWNFKTRNNNELELLAKGSRMIK